MLTASLRVAVPVELERSRGGPFTQIPRTYPYSRICSEIGQGVEGDQFLALRNRVVEGG